MVDCEFKTHHTKFCTPSSKADRTIGPLNRVIFEKNAIFFLYTPRNCCRTPVTGLKRCDLRFCVCLTHFQFDLRQWRAVNFYIWQVKKKQGKIWYFIQIHDIQIASDRGCQNDSLKIPETSQKKSWKKPVLLIT